MFDELEKMYKNLSRRYYINRTYPLFGMIAAIASVASLAVLGVLSEIPEKLQTEPIRVIAGISGIVGSAIVASYFFKKATASDIDDSDQITGVYIYNAYSALGEIVQSDKNTHKKAIKAGTQPAGCFGKAIVDRDGAYKAKVHNDPSMKSAC